MAEKTPFYNLHLQYKAKIVEFAGFLMPIQYSGIIQEHKRVRTTVGLFDVSHMGEIEIRGKKAVEFVSRVTTNDPGALAVNQVQYSAMCYPDGGIVDDLLVYRFPDYFFLVVNAANTKKDYEWLLQQVRSGEEVQVRNISSEVAQLALQGPKSEMVLQKIVDTDLSAMKYYWFTEGKVAGVKSIVSRTGYTGEDGFELYFTPPEAERIWRAVFSAGKDYEIEPVGLGARDSLRLEMKYCLYGNDIDQTTTPLEAGLGWITKLEKPELVGREALLRQKQEGVKRKLIGFEVEGQNFPRQHYKIYKGDQQIGQVTSGLFSPSISKGIGMGYVHSEFSKIGTPLEIEIRGKRIPGKIVETPFYKQATHK
ncbi:MAG: glycine cleavage system aminomethyltransferase GcvT [Candidatus Edwardsbacteria bacterium]